MDSLEAIRTGNAWKKILFGAFSPLLAYIVFETKHSDRSAVFLVEFLSALRFYVHTRNHEEFLLSLVLGASCLVLARCVGTTHVGVVLICCILNNWVASHLDNLNPLLYSIYLNSMIFMFLKRFGLDERLFADSYRLMVGVEYLLVVDKWQSDFFLLLPLSVMLWSLSDEIPAADVLVIVSYALLYVVVKIIHYFI